MSVLYCGVGLRGLGLPGLGLLCFGRWERVILGASRVFRVPLKCFRV